MKLTIIVGFVFPDFVSFPCLDVLFLASFDLLCETRYINPFHVLSWNIQSGFLSISFWFWSVGYFEPKSFSFNIKWPKFNFDGSHV